MLFDELLLAAAVLAVLVFTVLARVLGVLAVMVKLFLQMGWSLSQPDR